MDKIRIPLNNPAYHVYRCKYKNSNTQSIIKNMSTPRKKKSYLSFAVLCVINALIFATPSFAAVFQLTDPQTGTLTYNGQIIIAKAGFDLAARESGDIAPGTDQLLRAGDKSTFTPASPDWKGAIAYGQTSEQFPWTREVATKNEVSEISTAIIIPPKLRGSEQEYGRIKYYFPVELLRGAHYVAPYGRHQSVRSPKSGMLTGQEEEGKVLLVGVQQIQFRSGKVDFTVDLSPTGPWGLYQEDPASAYKGHLSREGDYYVLAIPTRGARWGAKINHKIVLDATAPDPTFLHPINSTHYQWHMPATWRVQFTSDAPVTGFATGKDIPGYADFSAWNTELYSSESGLGWITAPAGKIVNPDHNSSLGPLFSGGFAGHGEASFQLKQRNAEVLVNVLLSGAQGNSQVQVRCNNGEWNEVSIPAGERRTLTFSAQIKTGNIQLDLQGQNWLLCGIIIQPLFFENEDYLFSRCWWAFGKEPWKWTEFTESTFWQTWPNGAFGPHPLPSVKTVTP